MRAWPIILILCTLVNNSLVAQTCTELGQNPGTAFPVCGSSSFSQSSVKLCGNRRVPGPCGNEELTDINPYWYKFTCHTAGTLGFEITPAVLSDDYDWQLFDITGANPQDVYSNKALFVACNWSGEPGVTGASDKGTTLSVCGGFGLPLFSSMPVLKQGHEYLLLVSHFTNTQSGYTLEFKGGTADITDPTVPTMINATATCSGTEIGIKLNKAMSCASLAANGSDFYFPSAAGTIRSAQAPACSNAFDTDSIVITLQAPLAPGDYTLGLHDGSDGNSLLDDCGNNMPWGSIGFRVHENVSAEFSYEIRKGCASDTVSLQHTGPGNALQWLWRFDDNQVLPTRHAERVFTGGGSRTVTYSVANEHCSDSRSMVIELGEKVRAAFDAPDLICATDQVSFTNRSTGNITRWNWDFGNGSTSAHHEPDPFRYSPHLAEVPYTVTLTVWDAEGCANSAIAQVVVVKNCMIQVPSAFTPNNDGKNDLLGPTNAFHADNLLFQVFNRYGQKVFESRDWRRHWDGSFQGRLQGTGTYVWTLSYTLRSTGRSYQLRGTTVLIR